MTFAELFDALVAKDAVMASRRSDCKTSLRYLAKALGYTTLEACPVADACQKPEEWLAALEKHWQALTDQGETIGANTRRNTRSNCRHIFRQAEAHGLIQAPLPPRLLTKNTTQAVFLRQQRETSPYQSTYGGSRSGRAYGLPFAQWPADIKAGWRHYQTKCGHRETTFQSYRHSWRSILALLKRSCGRSPHWEDLFDAAQLREFVIWHGKRLGRPRTVLSRHVVVIAAAMAKVLGHKHARDLADYRNTLQKPAATHDKRHHWVSLAEIETVANSCLAEARIPVIRRNRKDVRRLGGKRATRFQYGLMLKLLVRIPLRQRNVREIRLEHNLYKDERTGHWHLQFSGDELKIGNRGSEVNKYEVDLTEDTTGLVAVLEEFLNVYRPLLLGAQPSLFLFITKGKPFTATTLWQQLSIVVTMGTGKRFYPHLIRSIWATKAIEKKEELGTIATALGDTVATVMTTYYDQHIKEQRGKAKSFVDRELRTG